ncbi:MAG: tetratricopeptide repeat protein [Thermoplasmata archaeon]|nr:tetratricopeptide repeat protein [Thermoplasmata archaeon]
MRNRKSLGKGLGALFSEKVGRVKFSPEVKEYIELEQMYLTKKRKLREMEEKLRKTKELIFLNSVMGKEVDEDELRKLEREIKRAKEELSTVRMGLLKIKENLRDSGILDVLTEGEIKLIAELEAELMDGIDSSVQLFNEEDVPMARERGESGNKALIRAVEELKPAVERDLGEVKEKIARDLEGLLKPELMEAFEKIEDALESLKGELDREGEGGEGETELSDMDVVTIEEIGLPEEERGEVDLDALKEEIHPKAVSRRVAREAGYRNGANRVDAGKSEVISEFDQGIPVEEMGQREVIRNALSLIREGRDREAESLLIKYVKVEPLSPWVWYHLGGIYYLRGDFTRAKSAFQKANNAKPGDEKIMIRLADVYNKLGLRAEALRIIKEVLKMNPRNHRALTIAGEVLLFGGMTEKARRFLKSALRWNPNYERAVKDMVLLEKLGKEST